MNRSIDEKILNSRLAGPLTWLIFKPHLVLTAQTINYHICWLLSAALHIVS